MAWDPAPAAGLRLTPSNSSRLPVDEKRKITVAQDKLSATGHVAKVAARPVRLTAIAGRAARLLRGVQSKLLRRFDVAQIHSPALDS
ncbi:MAG TPA: hypothetical protein VGC05_12065 [Mycobacterium sp.]